MVPPPNHEVLAMILLYVASFLLVSVGLIHSVLGERYVLRRLARVDKLPRLVLGGREMMVPLLRFAWHLTTLAWFGIAAILALMAHGSLSNSSAAAVVAATFLLSGTISIVASRGRHYSWIAFFAIGLIALYEAAM